MFMARRAHPAVSGAIVLIGLAVLLFAPLAEKRLRAGLSAAASSVLAAIERDTGLRLSFGAMSPSVLRGISLRRVVVADRRGRPIFEADRVFLSYDLAALVRGKGELAISELAVSRLKGRLSPEALAHFATLARRFSGAGPAPTPELPRFAISGSDVDLELSGFAPFTLRAELRSFRVGGGMAEAELSLEGRLHALINSDGGRPREGLTVPLAIEGRLARDFSRARLMVRLAAETAEFALSSQRFEFAYADRVAELRKIEDKAPIDAFARFDTRSGDLSASLVMEEFVPRRSLRLRGAIARYASYLDIPISGTMAFELPSFNIAGARYDVDLSSGATGFGIAGLERVAVSASGDVERVELRNARIDTVYGSVSYRGSFGIHELAPDGTLECSLAFWEGRLPLHATLKLLGGSGHYAAYADRVEVAGLECRDLAIDASFDASGSGFALSLRPPEAALPEETAGRAGAVTAFSGEATAAASSRIRIEGSLSSGSPAILELALGLEALELAPFRGILSIFTSEAVAEGLAKLRLQGELYAQSDLRRISYATNGFSLSFAGEPALHAVLSLSGSEQGLELKKATISVSGEEVELSGSLAFSEAGRLGFSALLGVGEASYAVSGSYAADALFIQGDYGLELRARFLGSTTYLAARARELPLPLTACPLSLSFELDGRYKDPEDWSLLVAALEARALQAGSISPAAIEIPRLRLAGRLGPQGGELPLVALADSFSNLTGTGRLSYELGAHPPAISVELALASLQDVRLRSDAQASKPPVAVMRETAPPEASASDVLSLGLSPENPPASAGAEAAAGEPRGERYTLVAALRDDKVSARLTVFGSPLGRFVKGPIAGLGQLSGRVDGSASLEGSIASPRLRFSASLAEGKLADESLELSLAGRYESGELALDSGRIAWRGLEAGGIAASFDTRSLAATLRARFRTLGAEAPLSFSLTARGEALGQREEGEAPLFAGNYRIEGSVTDFRYRDMSRARWPFVFESRPDWLSFDGGSGELALTLRADGRFFALAREPFPIRFSAQGRSAGGRLEAALEGIHLDIPGILGLVGPLPFRIDAGELAGNLAVSGSFTDPELSGSLSLSGLIVTLSEWIASPIGPVTFPLVADGKRFHALAPLVPVGTGRATLRAELLLDGWVPAEVTASLRAVNGYPLPLEARILGIFAKGSAYANLDFALRDAVARLSGDLRLERADIVINPGLFQPEGAMPTPEAYLDLDLGIGIGRGVRVLFPSAELPIVSGYAEPSSRIDVGYDQTTGALRLKGVANLRGGDVFYIQRNFFLKTAKILFNENENRFAPLVTLYAERRERNDAGPVLVTLRADNADIIDFKPRLASDPPMSEAEIAALLGESLLGVSETGGIDVRKALIASSELLPQLNATKAFESRVRSALGLDIFSLRSQVVQRWLLDVARVDPSTQAGSFASYFDETELYAGKYLGESIFAHGALRLREPDPLVPSGPLRLDSEFGLEFDTPFGLLTWSVTPTASSFENLYISDQSLSLTWRLRF